MIVLTQEAWMKLPAYSDVPSGLTKEVGHTSRQVVVNAPSRVDYVDRAILKMSPMMAVGMIKYRKDGVLAPFGQPRNAFTVPSPTVFNSAREWPMPDSADPLDGWSIKTFLSTKAGPAKRDAYCQLYHYLKRVFIGFHSRLRSNEVSIELHHIDAWTMDKALAGRQFDRVEVSNISGIQYLGIKTTLGTFGPLLRSSSANSHATLVTLFLNAVPEAKTIVRLMNPLLARIAVTHETELASDYIMHGLKMPSGNPKEIRGFMEIQSIKTSCALDMVSDMDFYFSRQVNPLPTSNLSS